MGKWEEYLMSNFRPGLSSLLKRVQHPLSVWQSSSPTCPSALRETIMLLLIHLSLYCSPNQSPTERDVAKLQLPSCGCCGNRDSLFAVMSARCGLALWVLTRMTLVGDNEQDSAVMAMTLSVYERRSARGDSQLAWCMWGKEGEWKESLPLLDCYCVFWKTQMLFSRAEWIMHEKQWISRREAALNLCKFTANIKIIFWLILHKMFLISRRNIPTWLESNSIMF